MDDDLTIPEFLKRTETPEQAAKRDAKYAAKKPDPKLKVIEPYNPNDPIRKAIAKDLADDRKEKVVSELMAVVDRIENKKRQKKLPPALAKAVAENEQRNKPKHPATANLMESEMRTKTSKTKAKANARTEIRKGSKLEKIATMLKRKEGCTAAQVMKACGWPSVSMPRQAELAGLKLKKEKVDGVTVYRAA